MKINRTGRCRAFTRILLVVGCVVIGWWTVAAIVFPSRRFEAKEWKAAKPDANHYTVRRLMIDDLLGSYDFHGWSKQELIDLLGEPTKDASASGFGQWDMIYLLGLERSGPFSLDDEALGFEFDEDGRVVKYGLSVN
jgi:hypothetical protein